MQMNRIQEFKLAEDAEKKYLELKDNEVSTFELASINEWAFWSKRTFVKFIFLYKNNAMNKRLKRVGRIANYNNGGRIGTRSLDLILASDRPTGRNVEPSNYRYYDLSRAFASRKSDGSSLGLTKPKIAGFAYPGQWRSFGKDRITVVTAIWSPYTGKFESDFDKFYDPNQSAG